MQKRSFQKPVAYQAGVEAALKLKYAINDYILWMIEKNYADGTIVLYEKSLQEFSCFIEQEDIPWDQIFTLHTLKTFCKKMPRKSASYSVRRLSRYLYKQGKIPLPIPLKEYDLPEVYSLYLSYYTKHHSRNLRRINHISRVLAAFHDYLTRMNINLSSVTIHETDAFFREFFTDFSFTTRNVYRMYIRRFIRYLYEMALIKKDFSELITGTPELTMSKPPRFLRSHELKRIFAIQDLSSPLGIRTYATLCFAFEMGLRPVEISQITLDDISFKDSLLNVQNRKGYNPMGLPIPVKTMKAVVLYIMKARSKSDSRTLFLSMVAPYEGISPNTLGNYISASMRKTGLKASAYWLRHTYAQNLLESGVGLFDIKEMAGHDSIESTRKYLHISTELIRKVLFDETL